jgi:spore coat protein U-like protein
MMRPIALGALAALLLLAALPGAARAQGVTCTVSATPLAFGLYLPVNATPDDSTGSISVNCTTEAFIQFVAYSITLSGGGSGNPAARRMLSGAGQLGYQLYRDSARTAVWGTTSAQDVTGSSLLGRTFPFSVTHTVYGRIPARQSVASGAYTDVIQVIVTY